MINFLHQSNDLRLLLPETIWIEPEDLEQATAIESKVTDETQQWQVYLNTLAQLSFARWLKERLPNRAIEEESNDGQVLSYLRVNDFRIGLLVTENLLDELVYFPQTELAAHFYVVLEVIEEEEQVIIRGFVNYEELNNYLHQNKSPLLSENCYQIPLSLFDSEPNHLVFSCQYLQPSAINLPAIETSTITSQPEKSLNSLENTRIKLDRWLQGIIDRGWQSIDSLISLDANLALSTRNISEGIKVGKLINFGIELGNQKVTLVITIKQEAEEKLRVEVQLYPTSGERYLPQNVELILLSKTGKTLQTVESRHQDNYIQLKPFKGKIGKQFALETSLGNVRFRENFEL